MAATVKDASDSAPRQAGSSSQAGLQLCTNASTQADDSDSDAIVIEEDSDAQDDNSDDNLPVSFAPSDSINGVPDDGPPVNDESADESSTKKLRSGDVPPVKNESADESSAKKKQSGAPFRVDLTILANVSCTACSRQINPYKNGALQKHPELKVIICKNCEKFLSSGEISKDADGSDEQCRWCGEGGRLLICDECNSAFCKSCVMRNFGRSVFNNIDSQDDWLCYLCNKEPLKPLHDNYQKIKATLKALHKKEKSKSAALANGGTSSSGKLNGSRHSGKKVMPVSKPTESSENSLPSSAAFFSISDLNVTQENVGVVLEKVFTATSTFKDVVHVLCQQSQAVLGVGSLVQHRRQQHAKAFVKSVQQYLRSLKTILTESLPLLDNSEVEVEVIANNRKKPPSTVECAAAPTSSRRSSAAKKDANLETVSKKNSVHSRTASPLDGNTPPAASVNEVEVLDASDVNSGDQVKAVNGHVQEQTLDSPNPSKNKSKESSSDDTNPAQSVKMKKFSVRITSLDKTVADIVVKNLEEESQSESKEKKTAQDKTQTNKEKEVVKKSSSKNVSKSAEVSSPILTEDDSKSDRSDSEKSRSKTAKNKCRTSLDNSPTLNIAEGSTSAGPLPDSSEGPVEHEEAVQEEAVQAEAVQEEAVQEEAVLEEAVQEEAVQEEAVLPPSSEPSSVAEDENLAAKFDLIKELADEMIRKDSENDNEMNGDNISDDKDDVSLSSRSAAKKDSKTETSKNTKKHKKSVSSAEESGPSKTKRKSPSKKKRKVKVADTKQTSAGLTHASSSSDLLMDDDDDNSGGRDQPATRRRRKTRKDRNNKKSPEKKQTSEKLKETSHEETEDEDIDKEIKKLSKMPTIRKRKVADIYGSEDDDGDDATEKDPDKLAPKQQTAKKTKTAGSKDPEKKVDYEDLSSDGNDKNHDGDDETEDEDAGLPVMFQAGVDAVEEQLGPPLDENEIAKNRLLEDMESEKDDASSDNNSSSDSSQSHDDAGSDKKKTKEPNTVKKDDKTANSEDSDVAIGKRKQIRSKLLDAKLSDSDSDIGQPKKKQKEDEDKSSNSSLESDTTSDDDDSDDSFDISEDDDDDPKSKKKNKKKEKKKRGKGKKKGTDDSEESSDEDKKKKGKKKKLKRIKKMSNSSEDEDNDESDKGDNEDENDDDDPNSSKAGKRKQIRKVMSNKSLEDATRAAARAEEKRRKRVAAKQREFNVETMTDENNPMNCPVTTKLVLEPGKEEGDEPLIQVNKKLIRKLKPHQVEAVQFMWDCLYESVKRAKKEEGAGCILAHCMGLGKTLSVVSFVHTVLKHHKLLKHRTCLIVSPLNTVLNWKNEWTMWLDGKDQLEVWELAGCKQNPLRARALKDWQESGGIMIIGYEMYRNLTTGNRCRNKKQKAIFQETLVNPGPDLVVCDEGHILKNENSAISKAMNQMKTKRRVVLTGTPLQNNLTEYHCMLSFVKPNLLGTRKEFTNRFISPIQNGQCTDSTPKDVKLMKARAHILHEMLAGCVQRRDYSALTKFLPPKQEYVIFVRLTNIQIELYEKYLELTGQGVDGVYTNKGARMFTDYQNLMKIWTHPWVLKLAEIRDELKGKFDDEEEDSFIEDGSDTASSESTTSSSSDDDKSDSSAGEGTSKAKPNPRGGTRRTRAKARREAGEDSDPEDVIAEWKAKANGEGEAVKEEPDKLVTRDWWASYVTEDDQLKLELSNKLTLLFEILRMSEEIGDKVLVFSQSILSLNIIESFLEVVDSKHQQECEQMTEEEQEGRELYGRSWTKNLDYYRMDGTNSAQQRQAWASSFNDLENYRARLFLISTRAGGLGINLVAANRVIIFDASWNPSHDVQSIFRVYRFGQIKPCYIYRFLAQGTMEEKIYERQVTKLSLSQRVVDEHQIERHFSASDLKELYNFRPDRWDDGTDKPTLSLPKDPLLAEILTANRPSVVSFHEHDSLLENQVEQTLTEEEKKAAWEEYENEKKGIGKGPGPMIAAAQFLSQEQIAATVQALKQQLPGVSDDLFQLHLHQALKRQVQMKQEEMRRMDLLRLQEMNIMNMMRQHKQQQPGGAGYPQAMQNMPPWMQLQYFRALQQQQHIKPKVGNHSGSPMAMNLLKSAPIPSISNKPEEAIDLDDN